LINQVRLVDAAKEQKHILSIFPLVFEKRTNLCVDYLKDTKANKKDHIEDVLVESIKLLQRNGVLEYCTGERSVSPALAMHHPRCITLEMDVGMEVGLQKKLAESMNAYQATTATESDVSDTNDSEGSTGDDESELADVGHQEQTEEPLLTMHPPQQSTSSSVPESEVQRRKRIHEEEYLPIVPYLRFIRNLPAHFHIQMKALNCTVAQLFPVFDFIVSELSPSSQKILRAEQQFYDNLEFVQNVHAGLLELLIDTVIRFDQRFKDYFDDKCGSLLLSKPEEVTHFLADVYFYYYYSLIESLDTPMQLVMGFLFETGPMVLEMKDACGNGNTPFTEANFGRALALIGGQNHPNYRKSMLRDLVQMAYRTPQQVRFDLASATVSVRGRPGNNVSLDLNQEWWHRFMSAFIDRAHGKTEYIGRAATSARVLPFFARHMKDLFMDEKCDIGFHRGKVGSADLEAKMRMSKALQNLFQSLREQLDVAGLWTKGTAVWQNDGRECSRSEHSLLEAKDYRSRSNTSSARTRRTTEPEGEAKHEGLMAQLRWWARKSNLQGRAAADENLKRMAIHRPQDVVEFEREHHRMVRVQGKNEHATPPLQFFNTLGAEQYRKITDEQLRECLVECFEDVFDRQVSKRFGPAAAQVPGIIQEAKMQWRLALERWWNIAETNQADWMQHPLWSFRTKKTPSQVLSKRPIYIAMLDRCIDTCKASATNRQEHQDLVKRAAIAELEEMSIEFWQEKGFRMKLTWDHKVRRHIVGPANRPQLPRPPTLPQKRTAEELGGEELDVSMRHRRFQLSAAKRAEIIRYMTISVKLTESDMQDYEMRIVDEELERAMARLSVRDVEEDVSSD
jgi:hypothetical protein